MEFNTAIYEEYRKLVITSLQDFLQATKEAITTNSLYKFGDLQDKLNVIEDLKHDHGTHFNFLKVKGVHYSKGEFSLIENEFLELIEENRLNLETLDFGIFQNENDEGKPFAYKSYIQVLSILTHCLELQIYREVKQQLEKPQPFAENFTPNLTVFKNLESHKFFDFLYNDWLKKIENCRPQLSYIVSAMRKEERSKTVNNLRIICPLKDFAEFWNTSYSHTFKLTFEKSKLNLQDEPSNKHEALFDAHKEYFENNIM